MNHRPIDILKAAHGKIVIVRLKNNKNVSGIVEAYDMHLNLWLNDVEVTDTEGNTESFDKFLVRGDNVIYISPNLK